MIIDSSLNKHSNDLRCYNCGGKIPRGSWVYWLSEQPFCCVGCIKGVIDTILPGVKAVPTVDPFGLGESEDCTARVSRQKGGINYPLKEEAK